MPDVICCTVVPPAGLAPVQPDKPEEQKIIGVFFNRIYAHYIAFHTINTLWMKDYRKKMGWVSDYF